MVCTYILDVTVITKYKFANHLKYLEKVLQKILEVGLKINAERSKIGCTETDNLRLWVSTNGEIDLLYNVDTIKAIDVGSPQ